ncbi:ELWxxDGT repeat protein [Runella sp.]|uniref:ELWxxDGT repeat protein n=1 Tax=Runella sp. TaxID=1960881 RepID=UPI003D0DDCDF
MKQFSAPILCLLCFFQSYAQQLLKNVYGTNASTLDVANAVNINGAVYFTASNANQTLLYKTDGTPNGTVLLNMASTGDQIQSPTNLANLNNSLIFLAYKSGSGYSLFKTNGSIAGTLELFSTASDASFMNVLGVMSNVLYFSFLQDTTGVELWRTDGTPAGTYIVKNINAGSANSSPASFKVIGTKAYFQANNGVNGAELWQTNGTAAGTVLVKDIYAGASGSYPTNFAAVDTTLFFQATNAANGSELWKSNGTAAGTQLVKDIRVGAVGSTPSSLQVLNNQLYFTAYDSLSIRLWKSNGTAAGTQLVKDSLRNVTNTVVFNNQLFFTASDGVKGFELWKSTGTAAGTTLLKDIHLSSGGYDELAFGSNPVLTVAGTTLYFFANDSINGRELWKTNGTLAGTTLVKNITASTASTYFETGTTFAVGNKIAFMAGSTPNEITEMWLSDGTNAGTVMVKNLNPSLTIEQARTVPVVLGAGVFFTAYNSVSGHELYRTDGTLANTLLVKDLNTEAVNSSVNPFGRVVHWNNKTFFTADDGKSGNELWMTDSARVTTILYRDFTKNRSESVAQSLGATWFSTYFNNFTVYKNSLYWMVNGRYLWKTDSTNSPVKVFDTFSPTAQKVLFATLNNDLYFLSNGLYKSDGNDFKKVTHKIAGIPARNYSDADSSVKMIAYNGFLYFSARGYDTKGDELWRTNGTDSSTALVKDINPGVSSSSPYGFVVYHNKLYFIAKTDSLGHELWQSDGTAAGTKLVKDINVGVGSGLGNGLHFEESYGTLVVYKDKLYFRATNTANGTELWQSDGTSAGTVLAKDIVSGAGSSNPFSLVPLNNKLYFIANNQLWRSDGTAAGTQPVKNSLFSDYRITKGDSSIYLTAYETAPAPILQQKSYELYRSDGTNSGTVPLTDIDYGLSSSLPQLISAYNGRVFFSAYRSDIGRELWSIRPDCLPAYFFYNPGETTATGAKHYFKASNKIEAVNTLQSNSNAIYQAGNQVELKPGFEVKAGAVFKAQINGCDTD